MLSERYQNDGVSCMDLNELQLNARDAFNNKYKSDYKTEYVKCLCGSDDYEVLAEKEKFGLECRNVICKNCGLVYQNPRMTQEAYDKFYDSEYRLLYCSSEHAWDDFFKHQVMRGQFLFDYVSRFIPEDKCFNEMSVLDIGCGAGGMLAYFKEKGFFELGIDLGRQYLERGLSMGLNLMPVHSSVLLEEYEGRFDIIILSHVLEHFLDIVGELDIINRLLKDDGLLYVEVPGIYEAAIFRDYNFLIEFQNAHTYSFTLGTLKAVLEQNGFELVEGNEKILSIFRKSSNQTKKTNRINHYERIHQFLIDAEKNRLAYVQVCIPSIAAIKRYVDECSDGSVLIEVSDDAKLASSLLLECIGKSKKILGLFWRKHDMKGKTLCGYNYINPGEYARSIEMVILDKAMFSRYPSKTPMYSELMKKEVVYIS